MWGLLPGWSLDLTINDPDDGMPWDFNIQEKRDKAEKMVKDKRGLLLIGSPMCSAFNQIQSLGRGRIGETRFGELMEQGLNHLRFCAKLYKMQLDQGTYFLHEQPGSSKNLGDHTVDNLMRDWRVYTVEGDMHRFVMGQEVEAGGGGQEKNEIHNQC